ncbi:hypothetical protein F5887DRAFT_939993 [Amanita rubescens]|nr:hypothetical protein F5887DRAFT_939993 [Amanita rubescens]
MDRYHGSNYYDAYQEYCDNDDVELYADAPFSDIQEFSDEPFDNGQEIYAPSPVTFDREYQRANAQIDSYHAYSGNNAHNQWHNNNPFQGHHDSGYESGYRLETTPSLHQVRQRPSQSGRGHRSHYDYEELEAYERQQYSPLPRSGTRLRPVSELPDVHRSIFKFGVFNAVQSSCFDNVYHSDENLVISAPTGSGKTVLFELAILRILHQARDSGRVFKCVYVSPTKALCSERFRDWETKFGPLGIKCCELTGDTVLFGKGAWGDAKNASIIVTTAEKWDSLTRTWRDHDQILSQIKLFLVDEIHVLNESRGSTLEVVVSRMKTRGAAVRFVLVSATVPNIQDVATWIGTNGSISKQATVLEFGEEYRPCKLARVVVGVPRPKGQNDFVFSKILDGKLFTALQTYSVGKPILVFCSTRNGVFATADRLKKDYATAESKREKLPWSRPPQSPQCFYDKRSSELADLGIGVHHAGLALEDRRKVENMFIKGSLRIIIATSTLAVGVNLPAHTVVIKGVHVYQNGANVEYSDLDIMQMIGRAGRPQFDTDGLAIILCESALENKYRALAQGATVIESSLHRNLAEHLNSEVGLGTIGSVSSAKEWLRNSFLFQRIRKNPNHYALGKEENQTWEDRMDDLVVQSFNKLANINLIEFIDDGQKLRSTEYGNIMSKLYIRQYTMELILKLPERPSMREILETISSAGEFQDLRIRTSEKTGLNILRQHNDIRFSVKKLEKTSDKVFIIIQAILGGVSLNSPEYKTGDSQPHLEALAIFRHVGRITRAVIEVSVISKRGAQMKYGLELLRCLSAKAWEDRPVVLRQIEQIGEKSLKVLAENGITSLQGLLLQQPSRLELLLNRRPPFGQEVIASAQELPQYSLEIQQVQVRSGSGNEPVEVDLSVHCGLADRHDNVKAKKPKPQRREANMTVVYAVTSDLDFIDFRRTSTKVLNETKSFHITAKLVKPSQAIIVTISSESAAGVALQKIYKPDIPPSEYPVPDTRPPAIIETDLDVKEEQLDTVNEACVSSRMTDPVKKVRQDIQKTKAERTVTPYVKDLTKLRAENSTILHKLDSSISKKILPNGNYECNHSCKDKHQCRHLCCKEGLLKPPKRQGAKQENILTNQRKGLEGENQSLDKGVIKIKQKPHPMLVDLENRHASTDVEKSLNIKSGQRIRLHYSPGQATRHQADADHERPGYHQRLDDRVEQSITTNQENFASKDDNSFLLDSDYSDPEVDSIIRAFPMDDEQVKDVITQEEKPNHEAPLPAESRKRKISLFREESLSPRKRIKLVGDSNLKPQAAAPVRVHDLIHS